MSYTSYRGNKKRRRVGKFAAALVLLFILLLVFVGWFILQDALIFTPDGITLDPNSLFAAPSTSSAKNASSVTLPPPTTAAAQDASELIRFNPSVRGQLDVENTNLPSGEPPSGQIGRYLSPAALQAAGFLSTVRLLAASGETAVIIDVKDSAGNLSFMSASSYATRAGSNASSAQDYYLRDAVSLLKQADILVIGRIFCLTDDLLIDTEPAYAFKNAAGNPIADDAGRAVLSPESAEVREYLTVITGEAAAIGFDVLLFDHLGIPPGYGADTEPLEELARALFTAAGRADTALMVYADNALLQPEEALANADSLWARRRGLGARYLLNEANVIVDTEIE